MQTLQFLREFVRILIVGAGGLGCELLKDLVTSNFNLVWFWFLSDEGPMLETLDYTIHIGSTPTVSYFDLYLYSAYVAHYVYCTF